MKKKKFFGVILAVCCMGIPVFQVAAEEEVKTIRVGVCSTDGYHSIEQSEDQKGYDYEYLMEIAKYTGWKYEFVEGNWHECTGMLRRGEIDLLGGVEKTENRLKTMNFGAAPSMYVANCLLIERDSDAYAYEDFEAFDGMRIGGLKDSSMNYYLKSYAQQNNFDYTFTEYKTEEELQLALHRKEIDSIFLSDFRNLGEYNIIGRFGYTSFYYVSNIRRTALKEELDRALKEIHTRNHYYESELYHKYFTDPIQVAFTKREKEYIRENPLVQVALFDGFPLISEFDAEEQRYNGIIVDALEELSRRTGLRFAYNKMETDVLPWEYMESHPNTIVAPFLQNSLISYMDNIKMLDTIVEGRMVAVNRAGKAIALDENFTLAVPKSMYGTEERLKKLFPKVELIACDSHQDGLDMVVEQEADMTLLNEITGAYMLQSPFYEKLSIMNVDNLLEDITVAVGNTSNPLLISILNKGISTFSERDIRQIVVDNTASSSYHMNLREWFHKNKLILVFGTITLVGAVLTVYAFMKQRKREKEEKQKIRLAEERYLADQAYKKKLFYEANFDKLTGLYNESYFVEKAGALLEENPDTVYAFLRINIVKFKMINEIFGKERGDILLKHMADKLRKDIGQKGVYGRIHSDNFVICYPVKEDFSQGFPKVNPVFIECLGQKIRVETHVGVYVNTHHEKNVTQILDYVQIALESQAEAGGDHIHIFKDIYFENMLRSQKITNEMESALAHEQFHVFLQPQFDHISEKLVGAEALVRWFHPTEGIIPPNDFIPVFEGNRFICKLDAYICEKVCQLLGKWKEMGKLVPVSVNLSRLDMQDQDLPMRLTALLEKYDIPVSCLHLEITESAYVEDDAALFVMIQKLRDAGFVIEMDDFGSGYSSLNMLKDTPVDILKLDMKFFAGESHMDKGGNIIETIVKLAHSLGILVIAEGVETQREANFLKSIGCCIVQGYLYGKPMPVDAFETLLKQQTIGPKGNSVLNEDADDTRYWDLEKFNVLMEKNGVALFDYDPALDCAVFTYVKNGQRVDRKITEYRRNLTKCKRFRDENRNWLDTLQTCEKHGMEEVDFCADYDGIGNFKQYHANVYFYNRRKVFSRVIAVIKEY